MKTKTLSPKELIRWFARQSIALETGISAGSFQYLSLQKFVSRADPMGIHEQGRLGDLNVLQTFVADCPTYRRRVVAPKRRILALIDLRAGDDALATRRLLEVAKLACGIVLAMPETTLTHVAVGTSHPTPPQTLFSLEDLRSLEASVDSLGRLRINPLAHEGHVKRALGSDPDAHLLIVTHFWHACMGFDFNANLGTTMLLVRPKSFGSINGLGIAGGAQSFHASSDREELLDEAYANLRTQLKARRVRSVIISDRGDVLTALERALAKL